MELGFANSGSSGDDDDADAGGGGIKRDKFM